MNAEAFLKQKLAFRVRGEEIILEETMVEGAVFVLDPEGKIVKDEDNHPLLQPGVVGTLRQTIPVKALADHFRAVLEDDVAFPAKVKKRDGLRQANQLPDGQVKVPPGILEKLLPEMGL